MPPIYHQWFLGDWFRGSEPTTFEKINGAGLWDYCLKNPEFDNLDNGAIASDSQTMKLVIKDLKPIFKSLDSLLDVGG